MMGGACATLSLMIVGLGRAQIVLGMPWLTKNNPCIDWVKKTISFNNKHIWKTTLSTELAIAAQKDDVILPPQYADYANVFSKWTFNALPPQWDFNHAIELKESFIPKVAKIYLLNPQEVAMCREFIKENLKTGCIQPSKSLQASPFFFVKKKDGKLHPVQDYWYLNEHTVKNAYPLPLITDLIDNLRCFSRFTKFDIHWGYNNIHIKDRDEWKAMFITQLGLFEPTVMFFGLCGSPQLFKCLWTTTSQTTSEKDGSLSTWMTSPLAQTHRKMRNERSALSYNDFATWDYCSNCQNANLVRQRLSSLAW